MAATQRADQPSLSDFPPEILALIFELVEGIDERVQVAQICRSWRRVALSTPAVWKDVRGMDGRRDHDRADRHFTALLSLCDERSQSGITYADMSFVRTAETLRDSLDLLYRSRKSLLGIAVSEYANCRCQLCAQKRGSSMQEFVSKTLFSSWLMHKHTDVNIAPSAQEVTESLFALLREAPKLEFLLAKFAFHHGLDFLKNPATGKDGKISVLAQPTELHLLGPLDCCIHIHPRSDARDRHVRDFFEAMSTKVKRLIYDNPKYSSDQTWPGLAWIILLQRAAQLESCRMPLGPVAHFRTFPVLKEASFCPCTFLSVDYQQSLQKLVFPRFQREEGQGRLKPFWFSMPALEVLHSTPEIAIKLHCPSVKVAYLHLSKIEDIEVLDKVLRSWPHLETLTIALNLHGAPAHLGDTMIAAVVSLLRSSSTESKPAMAPKLRHLGILRTLNADWHDFMDERPKWAAEPWWDGFKQVWKTNPYPDGVMPELTPYIRDLELLRRGGNGCPALESIKLGGIRVKPKVWRDLVKNACAEVTCYPHPLGPGSG